MLPLVANLARFLIVGITGIRNVVKPSGFILKNRALCFSSARYRNDLDSKWWELCHCCAGVMRIQDLTLGLLPVSPITGQQTAKRKLRLRNRQTIFAGGYFRGKIFSREDIFVRRYFRGKIFSREDIFAWTVNSRKYLLAKIFQIHFSRNFPPAKIKCYTVHVIYGPRRGLYRLVHACRRW